MLISVNGVDLNVHVVGTGKPLLLLHGFTGSRLNWERFIPSWRKRFKVIAVDIIGHGESDAPPDPSRYTIEHAVNDLAAILDNLNIDKTSVLGYSMGGRLALSFAMLKPDRVDKLILESASPGLKSAEERAERVKSDEALANTIEREGMASFVQRWENIPLFESAKRLPETTQERIRQQRLQNRTLGLANSLRGMGTGAQPSWWEKLGKLQIPTLLLAGEYDEKFCGIARKMEAVLPNATISVVKDAGHMIHVEQPQIFDTIVMDYLSE